MTKFNDFVLQVATVNGSGSQSANNILVRSLFRSGVAVGGKNLFPSNIQGLPTWFTIRVNEAGFTSRRSHADVALALNPQTYLQDLAQVRPEGFFFYNSEFKFADAQKRGDVSMIAIPYRDIVATVTDSVKLRKLLINMSYVGILAELLGLSDAILAGSIEHQFEGKDEVLDVNRKAIEAGRLYARENLSHLAFPYRVRAIEGGNDGNVLIDGNTSAALGAVFGGCTFVSWYPITPSTSMVEAFESYAKEARVDANGRNTFAVLQSEDELAAISMVLGAGWMGARAMTATSGPGLSLMSEAAGLSYYAEIPAVLWDIQRVGPSTGLPTRTMQGDLIAAHHLSHGDAKHLVLLPSTPAECFEFGQTAFDLAERLQTLVLVLSDLDLGMNLHIAKKFVPTTAGFDRGKVLSAEDLEKSKAFSRYRDVDGDGIPYRTLPGTEHPLAAYFTRGSGHDEDGRYTEDGQAFARVLDRLNKKWETARKLAPAPILEIEKNARVGLFAFGSTDSAMPEIRVLLRQQGIATDYLRVRALPMAQSVADFLATHDRTYVIEQNRDGQMLSLLRAEFPEASASLRSIRVYDGLPISAEEMAHMILQKERV